MKIKINKEKCMGCGACVSICPETFEMKNNKSNVKKQPKEITCEKDAINYCPAGAISIEKE